MLDLAMLGIGGGMPLPNRYLSASLVNYKGRRILIDCGEGTQVSMRELGWGFKNIDIICLTHMHGDHIVGLPGLLSTIGNSGKTDSLTIIVPPNVKEIVDAILVLSPYLPYTINVVEASDSKLIFQLDSDVLSLYDSNKEYKNSYENLEISTLLLDHSASCIGYSFIVNRAPAFDINKAKINDVPKILWGKLQKGEEIFYNDINYIPQMVLGENREGIKLSYITDTRNIEEIVPFIANSNIFVCEGTYGDDEDLPKAIKNKHMTFREAAQLAKKADVEELILTHFSPAMPNPSLFINNAKEVFSNTTLGEQHLIKKIIFK